MPSPEDYPRVLVITPQAFNHVTGTGVTFSNLFREWPKDRLACVHSDAVPTETDVCSRVFRLETNNIRKLFVPRWLFRRARRSPQMVLEDDVANCLPLRKPSLRRRVFQWGRDLLFGCDSIPETITLTNDLIAWIDEFRPDVIYSPLGDNAMMDFIERVRVRWSVPLVVHIMDDWRSTIYSKGLFSMLRRRRMGALFNHLIGVASCRMGICPLMCEVYEREFGVSFAPFQNTINTEEWKKFSRTDAKANRPFRIVYAGSIFPFAQLDSLSEICQSVGELNEDGRDVALDIYSPRFMTDQYRERLAVHDAISIHDPIPHRERYFRVLCAADLLVMPVNFDDNTVSFIRYSMPTKVPEYLLTGVPVLVYGPSSIAQVDYAAKSEWGYIVSEAGQDKVTAALVELLENSDLRLKLGMTARALAVTNHDAGVVRSKFRAELRAASF